MTTETTATILIGPRVTNEMMSPGFQPHTIVVLNEGHRAWWTLRNLTGRKPVERFIRPASPTNLLAAAILGFLAAAPGEQRRHATAASPSRRSLPLDLQALLNDDSDGGIRIAEIDDDTATRITALFTADHSGAATILNATVTDTELAAARTAGVTITMPGPT